jgi:hypothetical protein
MASTSQPSKITGALEVGRRRLEVEEVVEALPGLPLTLGVIPSSVHGFFDYFLGLGAIVAPWLFGFAHVVPARLVMQTQGLAVLLYSLFTDYEWGLVRVLRFPSHLLLDFLGGLMLVASPSLLGFRHFGRTHVALGLLELAITLLTRRRAFAR